MRPLFCLAPKSNTTFGPILPVAPVRWCLPWRVSCGYWWHSNYTLEGNRVFDSQSGRGATKNGESLSASSGDHD